MEGTHDELSDIAWFTPEGDEMTQRDWQAAQARALTVFLNGNAISEPGPRGERITDDSFLLMFNAARRALEFVVPVDHGQQWQVVVDTARPDGVQPGTGAQGEGGRPAAAGGPQPDGAPASGLVPRQATFAAGGPRGRPDRVPPDPAAAAYAAPPGQAPGRRIRGRDGHMSRTAR